MHDINRCQNMLVIYGSSKPPNKYNNFYLFFLLLHLDFYIFSSIIINFLFLKILHKHLKEKSITKERKNKKKVHNSLKTDLSLKHRYLKMHPKRGEIISLYSLWSFLVDELGVVLRLAQSIGVFPITLMTSFSIG